MPAGLPSLSCRRVVGLGRETGRSSSLGDFTITVHFEAQEQEEEEDTNQRTIYFGTWAQLYYYLLTTRFDLRHRTSFGSLQATGRELRALRSICSAAATPTPRRRPTLTTPASRLFRGCGRVGRPEERDNWCRIRSMQMQPGAGS